MVEAKVRSAIPLCENQEDRKFMEQVFTGQVTHEKLVDKGWTHVQETFGSEIETTNDQGSSH